MARAATRSQRPKGSQSQSQSQTRRAARRASQAGSRRDEDDQDQESESEGDDQDMEASLEVRGEGVVENDIARKAHDLARLALFNEHKRTPLRREEISKKILGSNPRSFNAVFDHAQDVLRRTFGMELVELRTRNVNTEQDDVANGRGEGGDLDEARKATGVKKKAVASGSRTYILRSALDPLLIEYASMTDEQILEEEAADAPSDDDDDDEFRMYGSIVAWRSSDQLGPIGVLYVILALILVNGRVISDMDLRANLKRLRLLSTSNLAFTSRSTHRTIALDPYLAQLQRQGFIDRQRVGERKAGAGKRSRGGDTGEGGSSEWRWGNRAHSEVGESAIARFVGEFMVERMAAGQGDDGENDTEEGRSEGAGRQGRKAKEALAKQRLEKMMKGIERAAGGALADIK